jgi:hypothetical protein
MPDLSLHHFGKTTVGLCHHSILARSCANGTEPVWLLPKCQYFGGMLYALNLTIAMPRTNILALATNMPT